MELGDCYRKGKSVLEKMYGEREAGAICRRLLGDRYGIGGERLVLDAAEEWDRSESFLEDVSRIAGGCPLQHITGFQEFLGRRFSVNGNVLIPRPETEQMVSLILGRKPGTRVLDIGTGSGAIAVTLALEIPGSTVTAVDVSREALEVAEGNAGRLGADVEFLEMDFLQGGMENRRWDLVVSNPPYVPRSRRLPENVAGRDPDLALFVDDEDPLIFYREISRYAYRTLESGGMLWFEIDEEFGPETAGTVREAGFKDAALVRDFAGKERFVWSRR